MYIKRHIRTFGALFGTIALVACSAEPPPPPLETDVTASTSKLINAATCDTNCCDHCFLCNPVCVTVCEGERLIDCARKKWIAAAIDAIVQPVENAVQGTAELFGWTKQDCQGAGVPIITGLVAENAAPICFAVGVPTFFIGTAICEAGVVAAGTAVATRVCTKLCEDHHLADCMAP